MSSITQAALQLLLPAIGSGVGLSIAAYLLKTPVERWLRREQAQFQSLLKHDEIRLQHFHAKAAVVFAKTYEKLVRALFTNETALAKPTEANIERAAEELTAARAYFYTKRLYFPDGTIERIDELLDHYRFNLHDLRKLSDEGTRIANQRYEKNPPRTLMVKLRRELRELIGGKFSLDD